MWTKIKQNLADAKLFLTYTFLGSISKALGAVLPLVVAKILSPAQFGSYSLGKMLIFFFSALTISSIQRPFIVFANEELNQSGKIAKSFTIKFFFVIASLIVGGLLIFLFSAQIAKFAQIENADLWAVFAGFFGFSICALISNVFMGLNQRIKSILVDLFYNLFATVIIIFLYLTGNITIKSCLNVYFYAMLGIIGCFIWQIDYRKLLPMQFDLHHLNKLFDFTKWIFLGVTASYFINWGDNLILRYYVSMEDIGHYNFAYQISKTIIFLTATIYFYFLPFIIQNINDKKKITHYLDSKRPKIFILGLCGLVIVYFLAPYLIELVYGESYRKSEQILRLLLISNLVNLYVVFLPAIYEALRFYKSLNMIAIIQIILNLLLDFILIPWLGIAGAAIATNIGYLAMAAMMEWHFRKHVLNGLKNETQRNID